MGQDGIRRGEPTNFCSLCGAWRGCLGLEPAFQMYLEHLWVIFDECGRVLKDTGVLWVNLGDTYHNASKWNVESDTAQTISGGNNRNYIGKRIVNQGIREKCLCGIPERFAIEMVDNDWELRDDLSEEEKKYVLTELINRGII